MKNLARILGIPLIAIATLLPLRCDMRPYVPHGTVNIDFPEGPYPYNIDIAAWDGNLHDINAIVGEMPAGKKDISIDLSPNDYAITALGDYRNGNYHLINDGNPVLLVKDKETYDLSLKMIPYIQN